MSFLLSLSCLPCQLSCLLPQEKEYLVHEKTEQRDLLAELGRELQGAKAHLGEGKKTSHDLETQLQVRTLVSRRWGLNITYLSFKHCTRTYFVIIRL